MLFARLKRNPKKCTFFFQEERGVQNTPNESMSVSVAKHRWPLSDRHRPCYWGNAPPKAFFTQCPSSEPGSWWRGPSQRSPLSSMQGSGSFLNKNTYMLFLSGISNHLTLIILLFSSSAQSGISRFIPRGACFNDHLGCRRTVCSQKINKKSFSGNFLILVQSLTSFASVLVLLLSEACVCAHVNYMKLSFICAHHF